MITRLYAQDLLGNRYYVMVKKWGLKYGFLFFTRTDDTEDVISDVKFLSVMGSKVR